jgi:hypothetical protein
VILTAPPLTVGVFPAAAHAELPRLLGALEEALPVRFEARQSAQLNGLDAALELGGSVEAEATAAAGITTLSLLVSEPPEPGSAAIQALGADPQLDRRLRGARLPDIHLGVALESGERLEPPERAVVLASHDGKPTWIRAANRETALLIPAELGEEEALRERLCDRRSAALLPLIHFLREITAAVRWRPPAARASLLFDDPNLHWPSYGFVKLGALGDHARSYGYHAALATVPLDAWFAHPRAVRALQAGRGAISLLVHGNDHLGGELGRSGTEGEAVALAAQARRRVEVFQRRTGIQVEPVMVPPHEECSAATPRGLLRCGFEAITMTRPFPWLAPPPRPWLTRPGNVGPLVGWRPADLVAGLPVLLRHPLLGRSIPDMALRSFLDQPLILYGHQADLLEGLGVLESAVEDVNRLRPTRWCSLGEIAAGSFETRLEGSVLVVRLLTRRARVEVPAGVEQLVVAPSESASGLPPELIVSRRPRRFGEPLEVASGSTMEVELRAGDQVDVNTVPAPRRRPLALPRRALSEGRDRLMPLVSRAR